MAQANTSTSFWPEIFAVSLYKPNSGRIVRQVTAAAVAVVMLFAAWKLHVFLNTTYDVAPGASLGSGCALAVVGLWVAFRLVNWPRFAEFLIDVEIEMSKVSWASWDYLVRATIVVIAVMFPDGPGVICLRYVLAMVFFAWLVFWIWAVDIGQLRSRQTCCSVSLFATFRRSLSPVSCCRNSVRELNRTFLFCSRRNVVLSVMVSDRTVSGSTSWEPQLTTETLSNESQGHE